MIGKEDLKGFLGTEKRQDGGIAARVRRRGCALGLAWTANGGRETILEARSLPGSGSVELTGNTGELLKGSTRTAMAWIRTNAGACGLEPGFWQKSAIHVHLQGGLVPTDGPSAGVTIATAIVSELTGLTPRGCVAMTGELSLHGDVLEVGGTHEKLLAAERLGVGTVVLPEANRAQVEENLDADTARRIRRHYVTRMEEVLDLMLPERLREKNERGRETAPGGKKEGTQDERSR